MTKHASNSPLTFVTHNRFAFFLPSCCIHSLLSPCCGGRGGVILRLEELSKQGWSSWARKVHWEVILSKGNWMLEVLFTRKCRYWFSDSETTASLVKVLLSWPLEKSSLLIGKICANGMWMEHKQITKWINDHLIMSFFWGLYQT